MIFILTLLDKSLLGIYECNSKGPCKMCEALRRKCTLTSSGKPLVYFILYEEEKNFINSHSFFAFRE